MKLASISLQKTWHHYHTVLGLLLCQQEVQKKKKKKNIWHWKATHDKIFIAFVTSTVHWVTTS